jgi:hypothetical protein
MKHILCYLLFIAGIALTFSCSTLKRYSSVQPTGTDNALAGVDLFGFTLSEAKPENGNKTLWDLSADAQSQFIKILNARYPDNDEFLRAMSYEYLKNEVQSLPYNYISKDLRMIFSISKQRDYGNRDNPSRLKLSPADRIEYLRITLRIPDDSGVKFTGWNMFTTDYGSIDIADVSFSRSFEIDASGLLSADNKETGRELSAGGKSSSGRREDQEIKYRYLKLNGRIGNNEIEMEEEGTREIDLTGNITADLSLEFDKFPEMITEFINLKDSTGRFNRPEKLTVRHSDALVPRMEKIRDTVYADLRMDYVFRNVVNGQKTFPEWDDRVKFYKGSVTKTIPLFASSDYVPDFYCIGTNKEPGRREIIKLSFQAGKEYDLIFRTCQEAAGFYDWLADYFSKTENRNKTINIGRYGLKFSDGDFTADRLAGCTILPCYR